MAGMWHLFLKEGEQEVEREQEEEEEFNEWQKAGPPINIYLMHSYSQASCSLSPAAAFLLASSSPLPWLCVLTQ